MLPWPCDSGEQLRTCVLGKDPEKSSVFLLCPPAPVDHSEKASCSLRHGSSTFWPFSWDSWLIHSPGLMSAGRVQIAYGRKAKVGHSLRGIWSTLLRKLSSVMFKWLCIWHITITWICMFLKGKRSLQKHCSWNEDKTRFLTTVNTCSHSDSLSLDSSSAHSSHLLLWGQGGYKHSEKVCKVWGESTFCLVLFQSEFPLKAVWAPADCPLVFLGAILGHLFNGPTLIAFSCVCCGSQHVV